MLQVKRLLLVCVLLVAACSGSSTSRTPAAVESAAPPTPVAPSPTAEASPSPSPAPVAAATVVRAQDGDVDGDGKPDRIRVTDTILSVALTGSGRTTTTDVDKGLDGSEPAATAGSVDVDRDGRAEVFVRVGQGASTTTLRAFRYDGAALTPVDTADGPLLLVVGGSVTHGDGFSCTDAARLVVRSAESDDGSAFTVTTTTYRIAGALAVRTARSVVRANGMSNPAVAAAYRVDCGSVGEGE